MKIILLRHGQTEWNVQQRYQGHSDVPLNDKGKEQSRKAAVYFRDNENIEAIYCSDLSRARQTAEIIGKSLNISPISDPRLREFCFGIWEGMTFTQVYDKYHNEFDEWFRDTYHYKIPEGESLNLLTERVIEVIKEIASREYNTVLAVTHGGVIKAIRSYLDENHDLWGNSTGAESMLTLIINDDYGVKLLKNDVELSMA